MNRTEIEIALNRDRTRTLEMFGALSPEAMTSPATRSEYDAETWWTPKDHFSHMLRVETHFNSIITAFLDGATEDPRGAVGGNRGTTREEILAEVNRVNEEAVERSRDVPFSELLRLSQTVRAETLALVARIADDQFDVQMAGVPWSGGTIGAVLLHSSGDHFDRHWKWLSEGLAAGR
jgi:hypothetical protein